jgi:hypothetical protein
MKHLANRAICLPKGHVYIRCKMELQDNLFVPTDSLREQSKSTGVKDNLSVPTGSFTGQSEARGDKTWITSISPQRSQEAPPHRIPQVGSQQGNIGPPTLPPLGVLKS